MEYGKVQLGRLHWLTVVATQELTIQSRLLEQKLFKQEETSPIILLHFAGEKIELIKVMGFPAGLGSN